MNTDTPFASAPPILAPLAGYTDIPFRLACRRHGCLYAYTALVDAKSLIHGNPHNEAILARDEHEPWLGTQILGACAEEIEAGGRILGEMPFDSIDLNMGCPVPKVTKRGAGAALGLDPERATQCVSSLVRVCSAPVTAKIRILSASDPAPTVALARRLEDCGIAALTVHGREWQQYYSGPVAYDVLRAVREALRVPVIANGGVFDRESAERLRTATGCDHIMVARGAIGNPWIFRELADPAAIPPSHEELCDELVHQIRGMVELYGEASGIRNARKIVLAYLTGRGYRRLRRRAVTSIGTWREFQELMNTIRAEGVSPRFRFPCEDGP